MKELRKELGLTQEEFGNLIGASRVSITQYEKGLRYPNTKQLAALSTIALLRHTGLEKDIKSFEQIYTKEQRAALEVVKVLTDKVKQSSYKLDLLRNKLAKLQTDYLQTQNLWNLIPGLKIKFSDDQPTMVYIEVLEIECAQKLNKFGVKKQALLRFEILMLEKEIDSAKLIMDEVSSLTLPLPQQI
ncbi:helix-turn-helix domain-containing protein [Pedobacter sp.]|uniref:helix-turn-helix domain-containing protein n=1 Tax=Pedobacter sp. TaxID=1411316 RepID=UPI003BAB7521